jgi:hypothetical protein
MHGSDQGYSARRSGDSRMLNFHQRDQHNHLRQNMIVH